MTSASANRAANAATVPAGLFPLPLEPFEAFNLADDRPDYPKAFVIELQLTGCLDRPTWEAALASALAVHPMLRARVERSRRRGDVWVLTDQPPRHDWAPLGAPLPDDYRSQIDIRQRPGFAAFVRHSPETTQVLLRFHHACCDGLGAFAFAEDLLTAYHRSAAAAPVVGRQVDMARLAKRSDIGIPRRTWREQIGDVWAGGRGAWAFYREKPTPLAAPDAETTPHPLPADHPGFVTTTCDDDLLSALRRTASRSAATLNDLLLSELFHTLRDWNRAHGRSAADAVFRILMPTSVRPRGAQTMPAANVMSFAFLSRPSAACDDAAMLLQGIRDETDTIRRQRLSLYFLGTLALLRSIPFALRYFLNDRHGFATAVLTNVGDPTRRFVARLPRDRGRIVVGNLRLARIAGVPPIRPQTRVGLSIVTYANQLCISTQCDPHLFGLDDSLQFHDRYVARLSRVARRNEDASSPTAPVDRA